MPPPAPPPTLYTATPTAQMGTQGLHYCNPPLPPSITLSHLKFAGYEYILKIGNENLVNLSLICIVHKLNNKTLHINHNFDYEMKNLPYEL